ncbi:translation initiation factor IF-2 subunit gamma [Candidatus Woesearchaeota archaeon]|nr:translation initiation factor IF-2 subunit gamma [Candidatus Woesearchaeota archaeon]MBT4387148.1 translation initiation factor IF-2 subunit gamma [Candidatus Woesearchaeota archaeon]MBT4596095.1 translation initiation factor IF-2 subunit gamma [Candidatus Woesearchaeota archaeon]MBT5741683.1 translation initiation factor IF-2 subunit gamma [Candidatus Woesearchaeota archaeon]MBT6505789.1 translation initiation factor IF-2 subunit gamma [Candidatus Woesearchaeota archaeon]
MSEEYEFLKPKEDGQPSINIGFVGHVDHGKTTLTKALSGKWTDEHSEEIKRGITIRLGYADCIFYKNKQDKYTIQKKDEKGNKNTFVRKISLVDSPGHETLMATMLSGSTIIDGALLLVSANEVCPQPQTKEHIQALEILGIKNIIIVQNKIDTVPEKIVKKNYEQIKEFLSNTSFKNSPIIPISALHDVNIDVLIQVIEEVITTPKRKINSQPKMFVARSFDVNKPGSSPDKMIGGVLGGALIEGILKVGDNIEIAPGRKIESHGKVTYEPIETTITGIKTGGKSVETVYPGGSIALLTNLDPSIIKSDQIGGATIGHKDKLPPTLYELNIDANLLKQTIDNLNIGPLAMREPLLLNVNSSKTVCTVNKVKKNKANLILKIPVCANEGDLVTISRRFGTRWRLIGSATIEK